MLRPLLLVPALAVACLLAGPPAAAPAASSGPDSAAIELELPANHGFKAHLETFNGEVTLAISRRNRYASYRVDGESTEAGLNVRFGTLGLIDVAFQPTKTRLEKPPKGCAGEPGRTSEGVFTGTVEFSGERGYVRIEATRVEGTIWVSHESEWKCPGLERTAVPGGAPRLPAGSPRKPAETGRETAMLAALDRRGGRFFAAFSAPENRGHGQSAFVGGTFEKKEGMQITRATVASAGPWAFVFDHKAGTARVRPPRPFTGRATYKRRPHRRDVWRSTIRVPLLGSAPLNTRGRRFRARLVRALPGD